ncbi:MAG TPA: Flp family type IVb pilin [Peptococcaceae bacterium]|nr:Flp family type IVb pilin [Peptococcaceae bacterium]HPZ71642.1 Flp family type IVb pilin [Peptococcaceae bacterium]HQD54200.1 Flp family type IVb pilin [Peptococcaceae bacterium]
MLSIFERLVREEEGQGMAEYGLILALIVLVVITVFTNLGQAIKGKIEDVVQAIN